MAIWTIFRRNKPMAKSDSERLKQLEFDFTDLKSDFDALNRKHHKLAGAYYSRFGAKAVPEEGVDSDRRLSSDEILARAGFKPGLPMPTQKETDR